MGVNELGLIKEQFGGLLIKSFVPFEDSLTQNRTKYFGADVNIKRDRLNHHFNVKVYFGENKKKFRVNQFSKLKLNIHREITKLGGNPKVYDVCK